MNKEHRILLKRNVVLLSTYIELERIKHLLLEKKVFSNEMMDDIMAKETEGERKETLILELRTRGPKAFDTFIEILQDTGLNEAAGILKQDSLVRRLPRQGNTLAECQESCEMRVKNAVNPMIGNSYYKMTSRPRGFCLIINNVTFEPPYENRIGAKIDADRLYAVFSELDYKVDLKTDLTSEEMLSYLYTFSQKEEHSKVDSCIVTIMTHGKKGMLYGVDGEAIRVEEVIQLFNNQNCYRLKGKPKVFFLQACRGSEFDEGVPGPERTDSVKLSEPSVKFHRIPTCTDILIAYSTIEGYVSIRNEYSGSWFCHHLAKVLMEKAWNTHLVDMLKDVCREVKRLISKDGVKQAPQCDMRGWDKSLYFNPGL